MPSPFNLYTSFEILMAMFFIKSFVIRRIMMGRMIYGYFSYLAHLFLVSDSS